MAEVMSPAVAEHKTSRHVRTQEVSILAFPQSKTKASDVLLKSFKREHRHRCGNTDVADSHLLHIDVREARPGKTWRA